MTSPIIQRLEKMLADGKDSALLRFGLGNEHARLGQHELAAEHLRVAVSLDPGYSAAWKLLGKSLAQAGRQKDALDAYREGIRIATEKGDLQAAKEMNVFARRIETSLGAG